MNFSQAGSGSALKKTAGSGSAFEYVSTALMMGIRNSRCTLHRVTDLLHVASEEDDVQLAVLHTPHQHWHQPITRHMSFNKV